MRKSIFVVTHGSKGKGANPGMTLEGSEQVSALRGLIPGAPTAVVCGTGRRHLDVAKALGLEPTRYTGAIGGGDSLEMVEGEKMIVLTDGTYVRPEQYTTLADTSPAWLFPCPMAPWFALVDPA